MELKHSRIIICAAAVLALSLGGCTAEIENPQETDDPTDAIVKVTLGMDDGTKAGLSDLETAFWEEGDVIQWHDSEGNSTSYTLKAADLTDQYHATFNAVIPNLASKDVQGFFSKGCSGQAIFASETTQQAAGAMDGAQIKFISDKGYRTITRGTEEIELSMELAGGILRFIPYTTSRGTESIVSIRIETGAYIAGTVAYDHDQGECSTPTGDTSKSACVTLSTPMALAGVNSKETSSGIYLSIPERTFTGYRVTVSTDAAKYVFETDKEMSVAANTVKNVYLNLDKAARYASESVKLELTAAMVSTNAPMEYVTQGKNPDAYGWGNPDWFLPLESAAAEARRAKFGLASNLFDDDDATCFHTNMDWGVSYSSWGCRTAGEGCAQHYIQVTLGSNVDSLDEIKFRNSDWTALGDGSLRILTSPDGSAFTTFSSLSSIGTGDLRSVKDLAPDGGIKAVRFLYDTSVGWTGCGNSFGLAELEFYAQSGSEPLPYVPLAQGDEEGDEDIEITDNDHYEVSIYVGGEWKRVQVRDALCSNAARHGQIWNDWSNSKNLRDNMCYALFDNAFTSDVKVRVKKLDGNFTSAAVRPGNYGITPTSVGDNTIEFDLPYSKRKVSVEFDGDRYHNLFLIGARPDQDKPTSSSPNVRYFGPGEHNEGTITLTAGQTLYIDYGAVVYATVRVTGDGCTIAGHGVLSGELLDHWGESGYSCGDVLIQVNPATASCMNGFTLKDVTIIDSPSWTCKMNWIYGVDIDGVNMICWILNGDGLDLVSCSNVEIQNCFLRNYDDCITLKVQDAYTFRPDLCDVHIHDCLLWNDYAHGLVVGPESGNSSTGSGSIHDVLIEDCIFLDNVNSVETDYANAAFAIYQVRQVNWGNQNAGNANDIESITAKNLYFDDIQSSGRNVFIKQNSNMETSCTMSGITLENFTISDRNHVQTPACEIQANQNTITGLNVKNFIFSGNKITSTGSNFVVSGMVDVSFQ